MPCLARPTVTGLLLAWVAGLSAAPIKPTGVLTPEETCPGSIEFGGYGTVNIVATQWNVAKDPAGKVEVRDNRVIPHYKGRSYFADRCRPGKYNHADYAAVPLLGKSMTFTTNLAEAGCGCNVALYLTSLAQHSEISKCKDYYCDANSVCGVKCHEIDIMEANRFAFRSSLHTEDDRYGLSMGYGGGGANWNGARDWTSSQYGPDGECINTTMPFQVTAAFPKSASGTLEAMVITLSQGRPCDLNLRLRGYDGNTSISPSGSGHGMLALGEALAAGMTPIASLWGASDMGWMDGLGNDTLGPCETDSEDNCPNSADMYDFFLAELPPPESPRRRRNYMWILGALVILAVAAALAHFFCSKAKENHDSLTEMSSESE